MAWSARDIPDLTGRAAVVTGANGGLGLETARELARSGAIVVMAVRDLDKARHARADIESEVPAAAVELVELDLGSLASVRAAAETILETHPTVGILVNNAGIMGVPERRTVDGFEAQFAVNHLGHFVLTARLLPAMLTTPGARVVSVTSTARHFGRPIDPANPQMEDDYDAWQAYGRSKLANLHFAIGLHRRLVDAGATTASLVAHPGLTRSGLQVHSASARPHWSNRFWEIAAATTGMAPSAGALSQLRAATDPAVRSGELYAPRWVNFGPPVRRPLMGRSLSEPAIGTLWAISEKETGEPFDVAAITGR